ncbi:MAG: SDR family oxidoreductase, partial [Actinobacteria bacterium]|nr:SDR family oxidoreductase [Actinomycetota bacterium]
MSSDYYAGRLAVVTGAGSGMGRELVRQLAASGCSVAACDLDQAALEESLALTRDVASHGVRLSAHVGDVSATAAVERIRDDIVAEHDARQIDLLFNNAGVHGEDSFVVGDAAKWERVFAICWGAVYVPCRVFLPLLAASDRAVIVNTGSVNSFYAKHGSGAPCTAYAAAKFAVRGFTEALIEDLRVNAPSVQVALVMPGTVRTGLGTNSERILGTQGPGGRSGDGSAEFRRYLAASGVAADDLDAAGLDAVGGVVRELFMTPAPEAVETILDAIGNGRWRVLVGADAWELDEAVRSRPEATYDVDGPTQVNPDVLRALVALVTRLDPTRIGDLTGDVALRVGHHRIVCGLRAGAVVLGRGTTNRALSAAST